MSDVTPYEISSQNIVGTLIPYMFRGRKIYSLLCAAFSPIDTTHKAFLAWAQNLIWESKIQFMKTPMETLLKNELKSYFQNEEDEFCFDLYATKAVELNIDLASNGNSVVYIYPASTGDQQNATIYQWSDVTGATKHHFNLSAPKIADSSKESEYKTAIRRIIGRYTIIKNFDIIIQD